MQGYQAVTPKGEPQGHGHMIFAAQAKNLAQASAFLDNLGMTAGPGPHLRAWTGQDVPGPHLQRGWAEMSQGLGP